MEGTLIVLAYLYAIISIHVQTKLIDLGYAIL